MAPPCTPEGDRPEILHIEGECRSFAKHILHTMKLHSAGLSSLGVPGVPWHTQILADQLTLFQPGGTDYAHLITTGTPGFSDLPTALHRFLKFPAWLAQIDIFHIYLNHTIDLDFGNRINGMINMEGIPKFDIKFDIGIKLTTWIGHQLKTRRQMT